MPGIEEEVPGTVLCGFVVQSTVDFFSSFKQNWWEILTSRQKRRISETLVLCCVEDLVCNVCTVHACN